MENEMNKRSIVRNLAGLLVVAVGGLLLLNSLNIIDVSSLIADYWPLLIIGGAMVIVANDIRSWPMAALIAAVGVMFQLRELHIITIQPWSVIWPLIIIYIGVSLLFNKSYTGKRVSKAERDDVTAIMAGAAVSNSSKSFQQSNVSAIMGGAVLDLRKTTIEKDALVEVFSFWGGIEIIVPEDVVIRNQVNNIMAGTEDKTNQVTNSKSPTLTIAGTIIMAGVSIRNTPS